jgi:hypothetical protein
MNLCLGRKLPKLTFGLLLAAVLPYQPLPIKFNWAGGADDSHAQDYQWVTRLHRYDFKKQSDGTLLMAGPYGLTLSLPLVRL